MTITLKLRTGADVHSQQHDGPAPDIVIFGGRYWVRAGIDNNGRVLYLDATVLTLAHPPPMEAAK